MQARARVVERLRARRVEIDEAIFARVSDRWFDRTGSGDPEYVAGLRAAGIAALDYVLVGIERSGQSLEPVPVAVLAQARRAARIGVGLETVLRRYLAGYALLEGFVIQEAERVEKDWIPPDRIPPDQGSILSDVLQIASTLVDRLVTAVSSAYKKEVERVGDTALTSDDSQVPVRRDAGSSHAGSGARYEPGASQVVFEGTQRERIVTAIVEVVAERGHAGASVGSVVERARVSRRTFYEMFPGGLDDGLVAVMDGALARIGVLVSPRLEGEGSWQDGVRGALAALLVFFDSEPALARVCFVETLGAGAVVVEQRERVVRAFRALIVERIEREIAQVPPLVAESVMASVMGIIYARLVDREQESLIGLLGPLMGTVVAPFVVGEETIAEAERRGNDLARKIRGGDPSWSQPEQPTERDAGSGVGAVFPAALAIPTTRRLRECLLYLAEQDGRGGRGSGPSNREIAAAIGVGHKSQISKLLSQLQDEGLALKHSVGPGGPNEWRLTPRGEEIARALVARKG